MKLWIGWTIAEALTRTVTKVLLKLTGIVSVKFVDAVLASMIVGVVQAVLGLAVTIQCGKSLLVSRREIIGACAFGLVGYCVIVLGFLTFTYGGDVGVNTLITTLAIIPGGIIDSIFFHHHLKSRQWIAVAIAVLAGYAVLGAPSISEVMNFPLWVWLSFIMMLGIAINQGVTQFIQDIDPMVKNFWGGGTQFIAGIATLPLLYLINPTLLKTESLTTYFIGLSLLIGVINVGLWIFNVMSYRSGATIALKKLVMNGIHLSTVMIAGALLFSESIDVYKITGIVLYCIAFTFWDQGTLEFVKKSLRGLFFYTP